VGMMSIMSLRGSVEFSKLALRMREKFASGNDLTRVRCVYECVTMREVYMCTHTHTHTHTNRPGARSAVDEGLSWGGIKCEFGAAAAGSHCDEGDCSGVDSSCIIVTTHPLPRNDSHTALHYTTLYYTTLHYIRSHLPKNTATSTTTSMTGTK
jgi:hypothetical protein